MAYADALLIRKLSSHNAEGLPTGWRRLRGDTVVYNASDSHHVVTEAVERLDPAGRPMLGAIDADADAKIVTVPLLLAGLGIGALASQLGAVTVSAVPDELSPEVGGLQNTATNLGAAVGTALAGSLLIAALTAAFLQGVQDNPSIPTQVKSQASVQLAGGVPFLSDADLQAALLDADVSTQVTTAALEVNRDARVAGLRSALVVLAVIALGGLFSARRIPTRPPQSSPG
jgi:hypothetical protein